MQILEDVLQNQYNMTVVFMVEHNYQKFKHHLHLSQSCHLWQFSCVVSDLMVNPQLNKIEIVYVDLDYLNSHNTILLVIPNRYEESSVFDDMELLNEEIYYSAEAPL